MTGADPLADVRSAVDGGDWEGALDTLTHVGPAADGPEGLELRAQAAYGAGRFEASVSAWEQLFTLLSGRGDRAGAARAAAMIAMYLMIDTGLMASVRGWLRRAEQLLEGGPEVPAHALQAMVRTYERFMCGDMAAARAQAARSVELGERLDVLPAVVIGRVATARVTILEGHVEEGLDLLDEVGTLLMSGGADPLTTGMMYCELICAAQGLALHDRASEWTEVMERWRHGTAFGGINGRCRVHRAEILRVCGPCDEAEAEAIGACDELRPWMRREFGWPLVELGNIRLRKGDLAGAEDAFLAAHEHAWSPQPGLALLRLAQGDVEAAATTIADAIAHPVDIPSKERPPFGDLRMAPLLDAQCEIAAAAGDAVTARRAADALQTVARAYRSRGLAAAADLAEGRAALLEGDLTAARARAHAAVAAWAELGAPFEAASSRLVLAEAFRRAGNVEAARLEWTAARVAFEAFGAARWAAHAASRLQGAVAEVARPPRTGMTAEFRRDGGMRHLCFDGVTAVVRDLKGFRYLQRLLAAPGREFHVLDLVAAEHGVALGGTAIGRDDGLGVARGDRGLPVIDDEARAAYRRRLAEVDDDIEEATRMHDTGRLELAERDREFLILELSRAVGLGDRRRSVGASGERARMSVTRSLRYGVRQLATHHPPLAAHLHHSLRTGTYCQYAPDPLAPVHWEL